MVDIIHRIGIRAPISDVFQAISSVAGIAGWWTREISAIAGPEVAMSARFTDQSGRELGKIGFDLIRPEAEHSVRWRFTEGPEEWIGTEATFELSRQDGYTILLFGHRNWRETVEFTAHCSMKWAVFLLSLRALAQTGKGNPSPQDTKIDNWN
ncbi:SRPBCC domain-containing protein [Comamonas sp. Tr-654]|uniref:SRPBCC family protein n=1 Tax=Comamonas sp. Tr-654 TaxID=2608341 RepID=UPI00141DC58E|nr:SRPBCC domain-containing protein [Comamonas sp. Tr-654]NIF81928.1 SRPBCC domain-containing protein [Comamonas sp. Tr-654]